MIKITLPTATPSQNTYQRWHWSRQARYKESTQMIIRARLAEQGVFCRERPQHKTLVVITRYSSGRLDRGNFIGGCKPVLDALRDELVIHDDSEQWLEDQYVQLPTRRGGARTEIVIEARQ